MKKTIILALILTGFFLFLGPNLSKVSAITLEELQAQIQQLLQIIQQLLSQSRLSQGPYCFTTDLSYGMTSPEVKNLQIVLGVQPATGYFGDSTLATVKKFQEEHNIKVTGEVGPQTRSVLNSLYCVPSQCGWCGQDCIRKTPTMQCPQVTPPLGVECKEVNGVCTKVPLVPPPTKYSCVTTLGTISANTYSTCVPNTNGNFNSLEECQKVCSEISFKCGSLSGKYSMTFTEAVQLFNNSECKSLGDPYKLPIYCERCDPKTNHSELYNAIYGEDTALLDNAAYRIGECIINVKDKTAYINRGPGFCTGATGAEGAWTIVCAMQNTPQEGWYSLEGIDGQVSEIKLLKLQECSNCQLTCSDTATEATFTDSCTKTTITSYGGEFRCKSIGVPPKNPTYIQELIKNYYSSTGTCTDSDGGDNIYVKGYRKDWQGLVEWDYCILNPFIYPDGSVVSDQEKKVTECTGNNCYLIEYHCSNIAGDAHKGYRCPTGYSCQDGACRQISPTTTIKPTCTDSDGNNTSTKGTVTYQGKTYTDFCTSSTTVNEYVCGNEQVMSTNTRCSYKCEDGKCVFPSLPNCNAACKAKGYTSGTCRSWPVTPTAQWGCSQNETALSEDTDDCYVEGVLGIRKACCCSSSVPPVTCTDSDERNNPWVKGIVTLSAQIYEDTCVTTTTVKEYYCSNNQVQFYIINCPTGNTCQDGACRQISPTTTIKPTCTDSDGNNTSTKGTVTYQGKTYTDFCTSSTTVNEYVCGNEQVMSTNGRCSYKCEDGKCVPPSQPSCDAACKAKGYTSGTCRSWPVTPTAQWGCSQNETALGQDTADCYVEYGMLGVGKACCCSSSVPPATCTDSDGGKNIYTKGHAKGFYDAFQSQFETDDYCGCINNDCSKTGLWEYYCKDATILTREAIECPSGYTCQDGACKQSVTACTDTDGGNNLYVKGSCYDSTTGKTYYDYCDEEMGGTKKGGLEEVNCQYVPIGGGSPGIEGKTVCVYSGYTCPNGCKNGACLSAPPPSTTCNDSDGGNLYKKGSCYDSATGRTYDDFCDEDIGGTQKGVLFEVTCDFVPFGQGFSEMEGKTVCMTHDYTCPNGCKNGACLPSSLSCTNCTSLESLLPQLSDLIKKLRAALVQLGQ